MSATKGGRKDNVERNDHGILAFSKLAQKHWAYYVCQAETDYQFIESKEVLLSVHLPDALDRRRKRGNRLRSTLKLVDMTYKLNSFSLSSLAASSYQDSQASLVTSCSLGQQVPCSL